MITQKQAPRKPQAKSFDTVTTTEFLRINPLPHNLRHLEKSIRKYPLAHHFLELATGCVMAGFDDEQIDRCVIAGGEFYGQAKQRCGSCYGWTDHDHSFVMIIPNGTWRFGACCQKCRDVIERGEDTTNLEKNLRDYVLGGAE